MSGFEKEEGSAKCPLCQDAHVPAAFAEMCECLLNAFNQWYAWGEEVREKVNEYDAIIALLLDKHPDIPEPPGSGDVIDPPPKPPFPG